jgi:peptide deformylase
MAVKNILLLGDQRLFEVAESLKKEELLSLNPQIDLMFETILDYRRIYGRGRAIAAPQIGLQKRIICVNIDRPVVMINPELSELSEAMFELWDDCMSFPMLLVKVKRHKSLKVSFVDECWQKHAWHIDGDMAELIQHEYDHLDGILAIQRAIDNKSFRWV